MVELGLRILQFFNFCYVNKLECGISFFENEYHVNATKDGNIYSHGQAKRLTDALNQCSQGFKNVGFY